MTKTSIPFLLRGAVLAALSGAPALAQADTTLKIALPTDIRSTDPGVNRDGVTDYVMANILEGLVGYRDDASIAPMLAESYDISDDGLTYTFHLRQGITFQNGDPMTSADVAWDWKRYMDPATSWRCAPEFDGSKGLTVDSVETPDPMTVVFTLSQPSSLFLANLARTDCGQTGVYSKASVKADGSWDKPIGTGPFLLADWEPGQYILLDKFAGYKARSEPMTGLVGDKTPLVDHVRYPIVPDSSVAKAGLISGDIDVLYDVETADLPDLKNDPDITIEIAKGFGINGYLLQTKDPLLSDVRMRRAILDSLDAEQIVGALTDGTAQPSGSVVPAGSPFYSKVMAKPMTRNLDEAKALLKEVGYSGQTITILCTKQNPAIYDLAVMAQAMMAEAGINAKLDVLDWATQLDRYTSGNYQMMGFGYSARLDPALSYDMMSGDKADQPRKVWDNPEERKLLAETTQTTDDAKRQALFDQIETLFQQDVPMIPLYSGARIGAVRKGIEGYKSWAVGSPRPWGVTKAE